MIVVFPAVLSWRDVFWGLWRAPLEYRRAPSLFSLDSCAAIYIHGWRRNELRSDPQVAASERLQSRSWLTESLLASQSRIFSQLSCLWTA